MSDDKETSSKVISVKNDKTIKGQGKQAGTKTKFGHLTAVSRGANREVKISTKVITQKAVVKKSIDKSSRKTTKKAAKVVSAKPKASETSPKKKAGPKNRAPKKTSSSDKGKVVVIDQYNDDDDSLDLDTIVGKHEAIAETQREKRVKKPLVISVSPAFLNVTTGFNLYTCTLPKPGKVFYAKSGCLRGLILMRNKKQKALNCKEDSDWIETISFIDLCDKEFGNESIWLKTGNKNIIDVIQLIHAAPIGEEDTSLPTLREKIKYFFDVTRKRKTNATGRLVLDYCLDLPQGKEGGLGKYCLNKGTTTKGTAKEVVLIEKGADIMTKELCDYFKDGYTLQYDVPLNKFVVDFNIRAFLMNYAEANSWHDLSEEDKRKCYRDYPKKSLPDWDEIGQESY